jgi:hypothetical protein
MNKNELTDPSINVDPKNKDSEGLNFDELIFKIKLFQILKTDIFCYGNTRFFQIKFSKLKPMRIEIEAMSHGKRKELIKIISKPSHPFKVVQFLFKYIYRIQVKLVPSPDVQTSRYFQKYKMSLFINHLYDKKINQKYSLKEIIFEAKIYSKGTNFAKDSISWKLIDMFFQPFLNFILNHYPTKYLKKFIEKVFQIKMQKKDKMRVKWILWKIK